MSIRAQLSVQTLSVVPCPLGVPVSLDGLVVCVPHPTLCLTCHSVRNPCFVERPPCVPACPAGLLECLGGPMPGLAVSPINAQCAPVRGLAPSSGYISVTQCLAGPAICVLDLLMCGIGVLVSFQGNVVCAYCFRMGIRSPSVDVLCPSLLVACPSSSVRCGFGCLVGLGSCPVGCRSGPVCVLACSQDSSPELVVTVPHISRGPSCLPVRSLGVRS